MDVYSRPGNLNRHLEHVPAAAVADDADLIPVVRAGWVQESSLNPAEKNRVSAVSQQQRDDRPAIAVVGGQRVIAKGASFRVKGFFAKLEQVDHVVFPPVVVFGQVAELLKDGGLPASLLLSACLLLYLGEQGVHF